MVVSKRFALLLFLIIIPMISQSQELKKSFVFQNKPLDDCLKEAVESFGFYLSFKKEIFNSSPLFSGEFQDKTLDEMMLLLLKDDFKYKKIKEYVIVNPIVKPKAEVSRQNLMKEERVVFDTVIIEEILTIYDTQKIEIRKLIYDTVRVPLQEIFYDTISVLNPIGIVSKSWNFGGFFGPVFRKRSGAGLNANYFGAALGGSVRHNLEKLYFQLDASYQYLLNNVSNSSVTELIETRTDTISVFFVIENGVRTPVYITEEVDVSRLVQTDVDRNNTLQFLSFSLIGGYEFKFNNLSLGVDIGINTDLLLNRDELVFINEELLDNSEIEFNNPSFSVVLQIPFKYSKPAFIGEVMITPYMHYGINDEFEAPSPGAGRLVVGIKVGIIF